MSGYNKKYNYTTVVFLAVLLLGVPLYLFSISREFNSLKEEFLEVPLYQLQYIYMSYAETNSVFSVMDNIIVTNSLFIVGITVILSMCVMYARMLKSKILSQNERIALFTEIADLLTFEVDANGNVINANDKVVSVLGYTQEEFSGINVRDIFVAYEYAGSEHSTRNSGRIDNAVKTKQGQVMYILWRTGKTPSGTVEYLGSDVSELKEFQDKINYITHHDSLTGLHNKTKLEIYVNKLVEQNREKFAFIHLDLDNFKHINETFGYVLGDKVLIEMVNRINGICAEFGAKSVEIFRVPGDEFALIYRDYSDISDIEKLANSIMDSISQEYQYDSYNFVITASIGISCYPDDASNHSDLYKTAEIAMNNSKELGKHRISFFNEYMKKELEFMVFALHDMKMAFENNEYLLYYQPQYDVRTGKIRGFESLMRWISPVRGFVSPGEFIPYAEKSGLIKGLGKWALEEACTFAKRIRGLGYEDITVGINVSTIQVLDENFVSDVLSVIKKTGVDVRDIYLELTESILLETTDENLAKIKDLNEAGVVFALDDFGTGYSSLTYLRKLPFSMLKLDKTFVDSIAADSEQDRDTRKIVEAMIDLSHNINLEVVAEGVEQECQLTWLKERNCDMCQGYFTGRPMPENDAITCLETLGNIYAEK